MPRYVIVRTFTVDADEMPELGRRPKETAQEQFPQIACVPSATAIAVGDTVQFTNSDKVAHQLSFKKTIRVSCTPTPLVLQPAQSGSCIFRSGGTFSYSDPNVKDSKFHGTITVTGSVAGGGSLTLAVKPQIVVFGGKATTSGALSNRFTNVWDDTAAPAAHLVTEDPEAPRPAAADRTFGDDATLIAVGVSDRCHLDNEASIGHRTSRAER